MSDPVTLDDVDTAVSELESRLQFDSDQTGRHDPLETIREAVENREIDWLKQHITHTPAQKTAVNKWFRHYVDGERQDSSCQVHRIETTVNDYLIIRSEMYSDKKAEADTGPYDDGTYHAVWLTKTNPAGGFTIERAAWAPFSEDPNYPWRRTDLNRVFGFDRPLPESTSRVLSGETYHVAGDLLFEIGAVDHVKDTLASIKVADRLRERDTSSLDTVRHELSDLSLTPQIETPEISPESIDIESYRENGLDRNFTVTIPTASTEALIELQEDLDIEEETVRRNQEKNWDKLSPKRRRESIKAILESRYHGMLSESRHSRGRTVDAAEWKVERKLNSNSISRTIEHGDYTIIISSAVDLPLEEAIPHTTPQLILNEEAIVTVTKNGRDILETMLPPCGLSIQDMERHTSK